jgi:hypothetical protein
LRCEWFHTTRLASYIEFLSQNLVDRELLNANFPFSFLEAGTTSRNPPEAISIEIPTNTKPLAPEEDEPTPEVVSKNMFIRIDGTSATAARNKAPGRVIRDKIFARYLSV